MGVGVTADFKVPPPPCDILIYMHTLISGSFYTPFFKEVFEKKSEIEQAMEDAARLEDSGEGTLERPMRQPLPPPR